MISQRVYNKMNKTNISKRAQSIRTPDKMRILLKKRTYNKYSNDQVATQSLSKLIPSMTQSIIEVNVGQNMDKLRDYVKNRMKTEYTDRFKGSQTINKQFNPINKVELSVNAQRPSMRNLINCSGIETTRTGVNTSRSALHITNESVPIQTEQIIEKSKKYKTIDDIQARIQQLTDTRIRQCLNFKNKKDWTLESQLNILIEALKHIKEQQNPENPQRDAQQVEKKIELLQKLMAQKMVESEIMKKYYLSKIGKSVYRRYKTISSGSRDRISFISKVDEHKKHTMVSSSTINQQSYRRPESSAYNKFRHQSSFYDCDKHKQPLPRSSYKRQYLVYGLSPVLSSKPIESGPVRSYSSCKALSSSYQDNFGAKRSEKIDIKELDAYRDKFKNLPIAFMSKKDSGLVTKLTNYIQATKKQPIQSKQKYQTVPYISKYLQSQTHRQFITDPQIATTAIKHKNLHKLKYQYRKKINL